MCENSEKEKLIKYIESHIELINTDVKTVSVCGAITKEGITLQIKDKFSGELDEMKYEDLRAAFEFLCGIYYGANVIINSKLSDLIYQC
ncbi:hypothetical protein [Methanococcus maripaludis]|uniref:Uncharacterized protein n=2 Tax=Methanococcus maripaludis TaxID=39152 RepID=A0A7J9PJT7_METMI|nr:hypothetical protein [Methanococcus maripaludis]MBA2861789.1 hypothetical protein [Methanococcus maripaludis]